jgi:hypothetical protein
MLGWRRLGPHRRRAPFAVRDRFQEAGRFLSELTAQAPTVILVEDALGRSLLVLSSGSAAHVAARCS